MVRDRFDELGEGDRMVLRVAGDDIRLAENYEVSIALIQQPAAFHFRLGWGQTARQILERYGPGDRFELFLNRSRTGEDLVLLQTGAIDDVEQSIDSDGSSVTMRGRDLMQFLLDDEMERETTYSEITYADLTKRMLREVGLPSRAEALKFSNEANRKAVSGFSVNQKRPPRSTEELQIATEQGVVAAAEQGGEGQGSAGAAIAAAVAAARQRRGVAAKRSYKTIKCEAGESRLAFLQRQYRLAGLFLWCSGNGDFILSEPNPETAPVVTLDISTGKSRLETNVLSANYKVGFGSRHTRCVVWGRAGSGKGGRTRVRGEYIDTASEEELGFIKRKVVTDDDVRTLADATYVARRTIAEQRRSSRKLEIKVSGHTFPVAGDDDAFGIWAPDTEVNITSDTLYLTPRPWYLESIRFSRDGGTTTTLELMRNEDLVFAHLPHVAKGSGARKGGKRVKG